MRPRFFGGEGGCWFRRNARMKLGWSLGWPSGWPPVRTFVCFWGNSARCPDETGMTGILPPSVFQSLFFYVVLFIGFCFFYVSTPPNHFWCSSFVQSCCFRYFVLFLVFFVSVDFRVLRVIFCSSYFYCFVLFFHSFSLLFFCKRLSLTVSRVLCLLSLTVSLLFPGFGWRTPEPRMILGWTPDPCFFLGGGEMLDLRMIRPNHPKV